MEQHAVLVGILAGLWGALSVLVGVSMLLLAVGALVQLSLPGTDRGVAVDLTAGLFAAIGVLALVWGSVHLWTAVLLRRRKALGRTVMLALALANLLILPFGTALGIYALWVLLSEDGRRLFERTTPARTAR